MGFFFVVMGVDDLSMRFACGSCGTCGAEERRLRARALEGWCLLLLLPAARFRIFLLYLRGSRVLVSVL